MKDTETRLAFIKARSEGKSYSTISRELNIAKGTCHKWEHELQADIEALKNVRLEELYTSYNMKREARIKTLGSILGSIDNALYGAPLEEIPPEKLLELRLKYGRELRGEYIEPVEEPADDTLEGLLEQYNQLYRDRGKYTPADIKAQLSILDAKRQTLIAIDNEKQKEDNNPFLEDFGEYKSGLLRRNAEKAEA